MAHSLASHSVEHFFHLSNVLFYFAMFALSDVLITPEIHKYVDNSLR